MAVIEIILSVIYVILAVSIAAVILMQEGKQQGLGAALGGMSESYWKKNKGRSMEGALERFTKYGAAAFMILTLVINVLLKQQGL